MGITERIANLSIPSVIIIIAILVAARFLLLRQKTPFTKQVAEVAESLAVAMGLVFLIIRPFIVQAFFIPSESMVPTLLTHDHILVNKFIYRVGEPKRGDVMVFRAPPEASEDGKERDFIKRLIGLPGDEVRVTPGYVMVGNSQYTHDELATLLGKPGVRHRVRLRDGKVYVDGRSVKLEEIAAAVDSPKEKVIVMPGTVYINGNALKEPYLAEDPDDAYPNEDTPRKWVKTDDEDRLVVKIPKGRLLMLGDNRNYSKDSRVWGLLDRHRVLGKAMFIFWPLNRISWVH
ncbi:MAG: hypothetical protein A2Z18_04380 [Armatimonadetes bacterium RBG_16_58_9]|nr:MAG: hypothetical protein A2Z18_04380 [Armatimonadetes bacterium RBG_16_58_9]